jgi:hypothetical protein
MSMPKVFEELKMETEPSPTELPRLLLATDGPQKSGKTHFALTAPGPIGLINFDLGLEGMIDKFYAKNKTIGVKTIRIPEKLTQDNAKECYKEFKTTYDKLLASPQVRTVVVDTGTDLWDIMRMASLGALEKIPPMKYKSVNQDYKQLIRRAYDSPGKNLILIHKISELYKSMGKTSSNGNDVQEWDGVSMKRDGFKQTGYLIQANLSHRWDKVKGQSITEVLDCRMDMALAGQEFPDITFVDLAEMVFMEHDLAADYWEDWA